MRKNLKDEDSAMKREQMDTLNNLLLKARKEINTKNVKLDIVPLCKLLVQYYAKFTICMDKTCEVFEQLRDKQEIYHVEGKMQRFMESYFTSGINC